ncbi:MAG: hypothetical protein Q7S17_07430, partial [Xanthobacteraceae bacterium]|nr:hypothetical protein [Xanthobacteraceae bacterium]
QGYHAPKLLFVGDEAGGLSKALLDAADSLIANDNCRALLIGNPDDPTTEFEKICRPGSGWNVIRINAFDSPNFTGEKIPDTLRPLLISKVWVEEKRKSWGEESPLWQAKVLGLFPEQSTDSLVPISALRAAHERFETAVDGDPNELGIDVARFGDDWSVFYRRKGFKAWVEHRHRKRDLMELVGHIIRLCRADKPRRIKLDDIGMGGGVTDRLLELQASTKPDDKDAAAALRGVDIVPVNVGESAGSAMFADERFANKRAEINWVVRDLLVGADAKIAIGENDDLDAQATQIKYKVTSSGEIQIESKADMKKRTKGVSPDDWDALCIVFSDPEAKAMFSADEQAITAESRRLPGHWQRAFAFDMDHSKFGAVWAARDPHTDVVYIYDAIKVARGELAVHKEAMVKRGAWIPGLFDMKGRGRAKDESIRITDRLSDQLQLFTVEVDEGAANEEMQGRLSSNRLKVFDHLSEWFAEYRQLKRKGDEEIAAAGDHLMKTTAMLMLHVTDVATSEAASAIEVDYDRDRGERKGNRTTGY